MKHGGVNEETTLIIRKEKSKKQETPMKTCINYNLTKVINT